MTAPDLLAEINLVFQNEPYSNNTASPLAGAQAVAQRLAWPEISDATLREQLATLTLVGSADFRYYLPALLYFAIRNPAQQSIDLLLEALKLPIGLTGSAVSQLLVRLQSANPPAAAEITDVMQQQLTQTNQAVNGFIARASQLTARQAAAVYQFLTYWRTTGHPDASRQAAAVAIERYWFQFA